MLHYLQGLLSALDLTSLLDAVLRVAAIFLCLTVHETCHGLAALALGDPTAKSMHRLSLNPLRHIDWIGLLMMFVAGFGWAKPVPVDPRYFRKPKQGMALTALAGPVSNFVLAVLAMLISKVIYLYAPYSAAMDVVFSFCLYTLAPLSIGLGLFNLIPIPPLDGSKVLAAFLPDRQYITLMRYERYGIVVLLVLSFVGIGSSLISRGIRLLRMEDTWQLCSAPDYADVIRKAFEIRKPAKLSQPALEVLTIIAYYQPTTRAYVDQIRGVDSAYTIGLLLDRKLIEECGRLQVPGRPRLYRTTKQFLRAFHLTSLDDLPELPDLGGEGQMRIGEDGQIMDPADTAEITGADTPETAGAMEEEAP